MNRYRFDEKEHLHYLGDKPLTGTSSVINVLSKPLTWWASGEACKVFGWSNSKNFVYEQRVEIAQPVLDIIKGMDIGEYINLLDRAYRNHDTGLKKSAVKGKDLHAELEFYVKYRMGVSGPAEWSEQIKDFVAWDIVNVDKWLWSEGHCYSERLWTGGICDAGAILKDGRIVIVDFKSAKGAYMSHFLQCGGYGVQIEEGGVFNPNGDLICDAKKISGLIVVPFGAEKVEPVFNKLLVDKYYSGFENLVDLYRLINQ